MLATTNSFKESYMLRRLFHILFSAAILQMVVMCSSDDDAKDSGISDVAVGSDDASEEASDGRPDERDAGDQNEDPYCGDKIVQKELNEVCDDGNLNDNDGCTSLCELSCTDDLDCDDLNSCNGTETCNSDNYCDLGEWLEDGVVCGDRQSCFSGLCRDDVCGDMRIQGDEKCDDGDLFNDNGCTTDCEFSCETDEECSTEGDTCAGSLTCDLKKHTCTGTPKKDKEACIILGSGDPGWCMKGVCVPEKCGDGERDDGEQCDKGLDNGDPGSGCSLVCKTIICGNGKIEEGEQCDDGNTSDLDGCDADCQAEFWVRWTKTNLVKELSPEWCVHKGKNQMGNAFPGSVRLDSGSGALEINVLGIINDILNEAFDSCDSNALNLFSKSSDLSFRTSDDDIYLSVFDGQLETNQICNSPLDIDSRFSIIASEEGTPTALETTASQRPGVIKTLKPSDIVTQIPGIGSVDLHDLMLLIEVDVDTDELSTPPEIISSVQMPERMGFGDTDESGPSGRLCGALGTETMAAVGVTQESSLVYCCNAEGEPYDECLEGETPSVDCDSFLDVMENGCMLCDLAAFTSGGRPSCDDCDSFGLNIIYPTPPDIDTDGDGEEDAYSLLISAQGVRVRVTGVKESLD
jgi:cysteine-rich repeat protein